MRYLLSRACYPILIRLAREKTLCAFDFDGTLSPIVGRPEQARISRRTRNLLSRLAALYPCVILTGRGRADLIDKLGGIKVARVIGNHGAETEGTVGKPHRSVRGWKIALSRELGQLSGVSVEDKGHSLAVHYRQSTQKTKARRRILAATRKMERVRVFRGKQVVNLVVDSAPDKGVALAIERKRLGCDWVLYVGDDENDEDAFALAGNSVPVRIGRKKHSHARYYLRTQPEIEQLLKELILLRASGLSAISGSPSE